MGPKFKTPDGKEFTVKSEWRDYMMATFYSFKNRSNEAEPLIKKPGDVDGQTFDIGDCDNVTIVLMDACEQVQIDNVKNSRIFIGACASSIFIRNCENCTFYTACRQLRLREVTNSNFYIYSMAEVHIEYSNTLKFAPFNGGYPEQAAHLKSVSLDTTNNLWYDIFDHNDPAKSHENWSLLPEAEYEAAWYPAGECTPAIPKTKPGSVVRVEDTSMATFSATQLAAGDGKDVVPAAAAVSPTKLPSAPAAAADAPPIPAVAIAGAPPAPPTPSDIIPLKNDTDLVLECIAAYANFKAGDSMNFAVPDLSIVLSSGLNTTLAEISQEHVSREFWHIENISISSSKDMAWAVFWINISGITITRNSAVFMNTAARGAESKWQMVHVQGSSATALTELEVPKQLNL